MDGDDCCFDSTITPLCHSFKQADISGTKAHLLSLQGRRASLDRFIPVRRGSDADDTYRRLMSQNDAQNDSNCGEGPVAGAAALSQRKVDLKQRTVSCTIDDRILAFSPRDSAYIEKESCLSTPKRPKPKRYLPKYPDHVMSMPNLKDDFYCSPMAWSVGDVLAVANNDHQVATMHVSTEVCQFYQGEDQVRCVAWDSTGKLLAMGTETGAIQVWDRELSEDYYFPCHSSGEINAVVWNKKEKIIYGLHSAPLLIVLHLKSQKKERHKLPLKCSAAGLALHPDNKKLAIGGHDGSVLVWGIMEQDVISHIQAHNTATKALAWVPWKTDVLVTSGAKDDGTIKTWDTKTGTLLEQVDTETQVCSMVISGEYRELITGHGLGHNDILFWSLPRLRQLGKLQHHQGRVLQLCLNAKETTLASLGADEQLMMWECFEGATKADLRRPSVPASFMSPLTFSLR